MIKVVLCIPSLITGGAERFVVDLAKKIDRSSFDVTVAITRKNIGDQFREQLNDANIRIVDLGDANYLRMLKKQLAFLKQERPDVIHANTGSVLHMMLATALIKVPVKLYTVHNEPQLLYGRRKLKKSIYRIAFTLFGYCPVAISNYIRDAVCKDFHFKQQTVSVINNGVDLTGFFPEKKEEKPLVEIISTGRLVPLKNQKMIIEAFRNLHARYPQTALTILGEGEERPMLEKLVDQYGLQGAVSMPGMQKNVCNWLQKADVYVSASNTEGLPLSILEAMACGLPVVATDAGGTVDIVKSGENGALIAKNDQNALEKALERMTVDADYRDRCSKKSLCTAENWSIEKCVQGYESLYSSVKQRKEDETKES